MSVLRRADPSAAREAREVLQDAVPVSAARVGTVQAEGDGGMNILSIDPGTTQSAFVLFDGTRVLDHGFVANEYLLNRLAGRLFGESPLTVIEQIEAMGMSVGKETFQTVFWAGRFAQAAGVFEQVTRRAVKLHLCGSMRAKDPNIRQALLDRFGQHATKKGGVLHGVSGHRWSALAVGVVWWDLNIAKSGAQSSV